MLSSFVPSVAWIGISYVPFYDKNTVFGIILHCMDHYVRFICTSVDGHVVCSHLLAFVTNTMEVCACVFVDVFLSPG